MYVNEIFDTVRNFDLEGNIREIGAEDHVLTQPEITGLAVAAVLGILFCMFGLKIVRLWAALIGFTLGFAGGTAAGALLGLNETGVLIAGTVLAVLLAILGGILYRTGVFLTVFVSAAGIGIYLINPQERLTGAICLAIAFVAAILAVRFVVVLTIIVTSVFGAVTAGTAVCFLIPLSGNIIRIVLCAVICAIGIFVQLLLESGKQKKRNLKKAEEIRKERSTENDVERARAMMENLDKMPEESDAEMSEDNEEEDLEDNDLTIIELDDESGSENGADKEN